MQLPSMYFRRVEAIVKDSGLTMAKFNETQQRGILRTLVEITEAISTPLMPEIDELHNKRFKEQWKDLVERCMKEWTNFNIISALLLR